MLSLALSLFQGGTISEIPQPLNGKGFQLWSRSLSPTAYMVRLLGVNCVLVPRK